MINMIGLALMVVIPIIFWVIAIVWDSILFGFSGGSLAIIVGAYIFVENSDVYSIGFGLIYLLIGLYFCIASAVQSEE
jgi:hypothetical protein